MERDEHYEKYKCSDDEATQCLNVNFGWCNEGCRRPNRFTRDEDTSVSKPD
jgi:hypothetical protein